MEYNDNLISSPTQFEKLAKEYSFLLNKKHSLLSAGKEIVSMLNFLSWLYEFVIKNIKSQKIKLFFEKAIYQNSLNVSDVFYLFNLTEQVIKFEKPKQLKSFSQCLSLAIKTEASVVNVLLNVNDFQNNIVLQEIAFSHLNNIKNLASFI